MIRHSVEGISWQRILYFARELRLWKNVQRLDRGDFSLGKFYFRSNEGSFSFSQKFANARCRAKRWFHRWREVNSQRLVSPYVRTRWYVETKISIRRVLFTIGGDLCLCAG